MRNFLKLISFTSALLLAGISNQIYSSEQKQIDIKSNILISNLIEEKEIKTVTATGYGTTLESASQNAAENALIQVVGSFIDAETQIKKQKEIRDGVLSRTKVIKKDIRDYSQGSIKSFEILKVTESNSIFYVNARVDVRIEDFRAYIKELAFAEKEIDSGLFASIQTDTQNIENKIDLLGKIINPLINGEVIDIEIGNPQRLEELNSFGCIYLNIKSRISCDMSPYKNNFSIGSINPTSAIAVPIIFSLNKDFQDNAINILENISSDKWNGNFPKSAGSLSLIYKTNNPAEDYIITLLTTDTKEYTRYLIKKAKIYNDKRGLDNNLKKVPVYSWGSNTCSSFYPNIRLSFIDEKETSIWSKDFLQCHMYRKKTSTSDNKFNIQFVYLPFSGDVEPSYSTLYNTIRSYSSGGPGNVLFDKSRLLLLVEPRGEMFNKVKSIKLEYVPR